MVVNLTIVHTFCLFVCRYQPMPKINLEEEARKFLNLRKKETDPEELRKELIVMLERFLEQLKRKGP